MGKQNLIRTDQYPYHITARANNKEWFPIVIDKLWPLLNDLLTLTSWMYEIEIHAFVLMSNHFHLLVSTPKSNLDFAMRFFMSNSAKEINYLSGRINRVYGGRYKWSIIKDEAYLFNVVSYIYENPRRANSCKSIESYPYSTLHGLLGQDRLMIPISPLPYSSEDGLDQHPGRLLENLQRYKVSKDEVDLISLGLRKCEFKYNPRNINRIRSNKISF
ncbi:MAG: hypothetical protein HN353_02035 [Bdellovibrionales bacterium]|jgi:putative transposase|nr:hypothetical protein [Bdellovibrionales bacterium]MBT3524998.1 hypothetical protein [Bdellovibrionales bacterium]MBT7669165.1 hypothetical protein [Bdellovibrionales bacterium]MBT7767037.1 hypothetical protein [Bdellovibrionales bacterium]